MLDNRERDDPTATHRVSNAYQDKAYEDSEPLLDLSDQATAMREYRRYLHRRPELSEREYETTQFIAEHLERLDFEVHLAADRRGCFADIQLGGPDEASLSGDENFATLLVRADMDALPIQTGLSTEYRSSKAGVMHACGHDAHTAIVLGLANYLHIHRGKHWPGLAGPLRVRLCFQPAEETSTGGLHMIDAGVLKGVDAALALHVDPSLPVGTVGLRSGSLTAGCDSFSCTLSGRGGHGARPHLTSDTVVAAADWIQSATSRLARAQSVQDPIVLNIGMIHAADAPNVVPGQVVLQGTMRAMNQQAIQSGRKILDDVGRGIAAQYGVEVSRDISVHTPAVVNDDFMTKVVREAAKRSELVQAIRELERPSLGAEDFSFLASRVPACMFRLGVAGIERGHQPLHTATFDIDEDALAVGLQVFLMSLRGWHGASNR